MKNTETRAKASNKRILVLLPLMIVLLLGCIVWIKMNPQIFHSDVRQLENQIKAELGQLEDKSNDEIRAALNEVVTEGSLSISINANPVFPTGDSNGSRKIENGPQNLYAQQVIITLDDTGEEIYDSGYMPVNSHIQQDKLEVDLAPGDYAATAVFTAFDVDSNITVGQAVAHLNITVLN